MSDAYDRKLRQLALDVASDLGYSDFLREGVYCVLGGPSFETIAECRMLHSLGADAVGERPSRHSQHIHYILYLVVAKTDVQYTRRRSSTSIVLTKA